MATITLYPAGDTFIDRNRPDENFGTLNNFNAGNYNGTTNHNIALLQFDLSSIKSPSSAKLYLYIHYNFNSPLLHLNRIQPHFDENIITWNIYQGYNETGTPIDFNVESDGAYISIDILPKVLEALKEDKILSINIKDDETPDKFAMIQSKEWNYPPYLEIKEIPFPWISLLLFAGLIPAFTKRK